MPCRGEPQPLITAQGFSADSHDKQHSQHLTAWNRRVETHACRKQAHNDRASRRMHRKDRTSLAISVRLLRSGRQAKLQLPNVNQGLTLAESLLAAIARQSCPALPVNTGLKKFRDTPEEEQQLLVCIRDGIDDLRGAVRGHDGGAWVVRGTSPALHLLYHYECRPLRMMPSQYQPCMLCQDTGRAELVVYQLVVNGVLTDPKHWSQATR